MRRKGTKFSFGLLIWDLKLINSSICPFSSPKSPSALRGNKDGDRSILLTE